MTYRERWDQIEDAKSKLYEVHKMLFELKEYKAMKKTGKLIDELAKIIEECR